MLSFTLVGLGTGSAPRDAQAADEGAAMCRPGAVDPLQAGAQRALAVADAVLQGVGTGGAAGSGPPLNGAPAHAFPLATATPKAPTTDLVFFPLWARQ